MRISSENLKSLLKDQFFRFDVVNTFMHQQYDFSRCHRLAEYMTFIETGKPITRNDYAPFSNNVHFLVRNISHGKPLYDDLLYITDEKADELADYRIVSGDIIIAISSNCGAAFLYEGERMENITLSHYLCRIRVDSSKLRPKYLVYYLNSKIINDYFRGVETGKTQKNLSKVYIRDLPILPLPVEKQDLLCETVAPIEEQIKQLESSVLSAQSIIDTIFQREFSFDYETFLALKKESMYTSNITFFSNNPDMRFSAKFHRNAGIYVMKQLMNITSKRIKHYLAQPIVLGASISPEDYSDEGEYYYISMATIKGWQFVAESASLVSLAYSETKSDKTVQKNDIILARSGEGTIGKVALIENDIKGIFADFTMRIRLKDYNPEFAYYYFRTSYFQYIIEIYKKGLGNNTNIFPIVVQEFPLIDIPLDEQNRIVDEIHSELSKQIEVQARIMDLRSAIDGVINDAIING